MPQGGPISPTIFNLTLNGVEDEIMKVKKAFPIRFADDILVFGETQEQMEKVERHHIIPKSKGGEDTMKNTMLIHKTCHDKITAWDRK